MQFRDLIIVLPGITGSVLQKDGRDVWAASVQAIGNVLLPWTRSIDQLALDGAVDPNPEGDIDDGVVATALIKDVHIVPGLFKVDGYSALDRMITRLPGVIKGNLRDQRPANYFQFPYDWRRDNRVSALRLQTFIQTRLQRWREHSNAPDAQVILIGHSMGGLVSRYYLEVLQGWRDCKLLITFGTPYRGAINALDKVSNGVHMLGFLDFSKVFRSLPSAYQLLPRYPMFKQGDEYIRLVDTNGVPNLTTEQAVIGRNFLLEIEQAREENARDEAYHTHGYRIVPIVGTHNRTMQSAELNRRGNLVASRTPPNGLPLSLADGDGTVPRISAIPIELSNEFRESYHDEKHGSLQSNQILLEQVRGWLAMSQFDGGIFESIDEIAPPMPLGLPRTALALHLDDVYSVGEPVAIEGQLIGSESEGRILQIIVRNTQTNAVVAFERADEDGDGHRFVLAPLPQGIYRVTLSAPHSSASDTHDIFAVATASNTTSEETTMSKFDLHHGGGSYGSGSAESPFETIHVQLPTFEYLFPQLVRDASALLPNTPETVENLKRLADLMIETNDTVPDDSTIPAVYTYWGQFIDHDVTASDFERVTADLTDPALQPLPPQIVTERVENRRRAQLDLDSLYGDSPDEEAANFYDGQKFRIGKASPVGGTPHSDLGDERDLPRPDAPANKKARIGDSRNDENLIVAQFHTAFLRFHNAVVDWVALHENKPDDRNLYWRARTLVRFHYQWLVVNDYLKTICRADIVDAALAKDPAALVYQSESKTEPMMPLEYAGAVYRFGHSMVRGIYDYNEFFQNATFNLLFAFTGDGGFFGENTLPTNWIADWSRMTTRDTAQPHNFARKIDTRMTIQLASMRNAGGGFSGRARDIMRHLAQRNLLRGYLLSLPTGQALATAMGLTPLTANELQQGNSEAFNEHLATSGFLENTPLWYYILKEAEVQADGNSLGEMGSIIVAETLIGLLRLDTNAYLNHNWTPDNGVKFDDGSTVTGIMDVFRFAGVAPMV